MTIKELALLLVKAPLLAPERQAWVELVPYLSTAQLIALGEALERDVTRMAELQKSFEADFALIKKREELRHAKGKLV